MLTLVFIMGCFGTNEGSFPEAYAKELCRFEEYCFRSDFVDEYDDVQECMDQTLQNVDEGADCAFDASRARECLNEMRDARQDCDLEDRIPEPCADVFDCPGVLPSKVSAETFFSAYLDTFCSLDCSSAYLDTICEKARSYGEYTDYECSNFDADKAAECLDPSNWTCRSDYGYDVPQPPEICSQVCGIYYGDYSDYSDYGTTTTAEPYYGTYDDTADTGT